MAEKAPQKQLRATLEEISVAARAQRRESVRRGEGGGGGGGGSLFRDRRLSVCWDLYRGIPVGWMNLCGDNASGDS